MNEIVNKFLFARDKFMPEMHLKQPGKNSKKQAISTISTKMNLIKLVFNMIWHVELLKISQEEQLLIKFYEIKH